MLINQISIKARKFLYCPKSVLFETTKKRLINSHEMYGHPFMERSSIYVHILRLVKER